MSSSKGLPYFFNTQTKTSVWDPPKDLSEDQIVQLPGAHLLSADRPGQIKASHLLVKHAGSRRPSSWKEENITRTQHEAEALLHEFQAQIAGDSGEFARLATEHSDCSSHDRGGDLGWFGRGQMQKPFEDAAFSLKPGEMSGVIDTDSGVHLILRTA